MTQGGSPIGRPSLLVCPSAPGASPLHRDAAILGSCGRDAAAARRVEAERLGGLPARRGREFRPDDRLAYNLRFVIGVWQGLGMSTVSAHRSVTVERTMPGRFAISNIRGGKITVGTGGDTDFSPTELLLGAIGACTAIDVDTVTSRRAEPDAFEVRVDATKVRDDTGNRLTDIEVTFKLAFPMGEAGDNARVLLPEAVRRSHDRWCTVGRTVENGTPIATRIID